MANISYGTLSISELDVYEMDGSSLLTTISTNGINTTTNIIAPNATISNAITFGDSSSQSSAFTSSYANRLSAILDDTTTTKLSINSGMTITNPNNNYFVKVAQGGLDTNNPEGITINSSPSYTTACNFNGDINMNANNITSLSSLNYNDGIKIQNGSNNASIISDENGNLDLYVNQTNTDGGLNIYNDNGAYITFYGDGIAINDATNSIVGTNSTGLTLNSDTSVTLNAPNLTSFGNINMNTNNITSLNTLTYSNAINISNEDCSLFTTQSGILTVQSNTLQTNPITSFGITDLNYSNIITSQSITFPILDTLPSIGSTAQGTMCFATDINNENHFM